MKNVSMLYGTKICVAFFFPAAQRRLEELQNAIGRAEQQVLEVTGELQQLEGALAQKKVRKGVTMWIAGESVSNSVHTENTAAFLSPSFSKGPLYICTMNNQIIGSYSDNLLG